jgi:3-deoxy-D-manno-octulosonate 8-phosphate phosphatase (KDO 8-P phosphatase)
MNILEKFSQVNTFVFDMDGVLTDGSMQIMPNGEYIRTMDIKDGYSIHLATSKGYNVFVITGSSSEPCIIRLKQLGVQEYVQKVINKKTCLEELLLKNNITKETVLYMGDDMPDLVVMQTVAISCCPADACIDVLKVANYISPKNGGKGCVRDVIEKVMKLQGKWTDNAAIASI